MRGAGPGQASSALAIPRPRLPAMAVSESRFRVVLPTWDRKLGTLLACLDATLRRLRGCPPYRLADNERTVTTDRVAGVPVRHPVVVVGTNADFRAG
jgi:hypothetical protein